MIEKFISGSYTFQNIASRAKKCINKHDFAAVLIIFPILKQLLNMKPEFDKTVQGCDPNVQKKYLSILNTLHSTVSLNIIGIIYWFLSQVHDILHKYVMYKNKKQ